MSCLAIWVEDLLPYILMNVASYVFRYHYVTCRQTQVPVGTRRYQQAHAGRIIGRRLLPILPDKSKYRGRTSVFGVVVAASHVTESDRVVRRRVEQNIMRGTGLTMHEYHYHSDSPKQTQ